MTSEGSQPDGHEPAEAAPSAGKPVPYTGPRSGQPIPDPPGELPSGYVRASASVPGIRASASVPQDATRPPDANADAIAASAAPAARPATTPGRQAVSASAAVPVASRVTPPIDQPVLPTGMPAPQPRVYGTPVPSPRSGPGPIAGQAPAPGTSVRAAAAVPQVAMGGAAPTRAESGTGPGHPGELSAAEMPSAGRPPVGDLRMTTMDVEPATPRRPGVPAYSDLLSPAVPPAPPTTPAPPTPAPTPPGSIEGQRRVAPVAPPAPSGPGTSAPGNAEVPPDQSRFDALRPDANPEPAPVPHVRSGPLLLAVLAGAVLLLVVPLGIVWLATRPSTPTIAVGQCVKESGSEAVPVDCTAPGAFTVVARVDSPEQCPEKQQPYAEVSAEGGQTQVFCLSPAGTQAAPTSTP